MRIEHPINDHFQSPKVRKGVRGSRHREMLGFEIAPRFVVGS